MIPNKEIKKVFSPIWDDVKDFSTLETFKDVFHNRPSDINTPEEYINHSLYFEAKTFLHGLLVVEDKLSMAHSLETRVPFLDNDLVDFAMRCPTSLKLNNLYEVASLDENAPRSVKSKYFQKTKDGKQVLRDAMSNILPDKIATAQKQGFSSPDASWFRGDSIKFVKDRLLNEESNFSSLMDASSVQSLVKEHVTGKQNRRLLVWSLLNLEEWANQYVKY